MTVSKVLPNADAAREREVVWRRIYDDHFERVYAMIVRFGLSAAESEDIAQIAFFRAYQRLSGGEKVDDVGAWIRGIAVRVLAEHRRWHRVRRIKSWVLRTSQETATPAATPEQQVQDVELRREVAGILQKMSSKLGSVLVLLDIEQCTVEEAAAILGVPENTVRSRRARALEKFASLWSRRRAARTPS